MLPLSLFSHNVSVEEKMLIVEAMVRCGENWSSRDLKCSVSLFSNLAEKQLHDLVTSSSAAALHLFGINFAELSGQDPLTWDDIPSFRSARAVIESLKVVNDTAERLVALMNTFNQSITKTESEMQRLIQVVEDNRKRIPDCRKKNLISYTPITASSSQTVKRDNTTLE